MCEKIKLDCIFTLDFEEKCPIDEPDISPDEIQLEDIENFRYIKPEIVKPLSEVRIKRIK